MGYLIEGDIVDYRGDRGVFISSDNDDWARVYFGRGTYLNCPSKNVMLLVRVPAIHEWKQRIADLEAKHTSEHEMISEILREDYIAQLERELSELQQALDVEHKYTLEIEQKLSEAQAHIGVGTTTMLNMSRTNTELNNANVDLKQQNAELRGAIESALVKLSYLHNHTVVTILNKAIANSGAEE